MALTEFQKAFLGQELVSKGSVIDPGTGDPVDWGALISGISDVPGLAAALAALSAASVSVVLDGGGLEIADNTIVYVEIPWACTITAGRLFADVSGSAAVSVWKGTYANYPPVVGDKISASAPLTITTTTKSQDTTLTGWTKSVSAGDVLAFNVDSCTTITKLTVALRATRT